MPDGTLPVYQHWPGNWRPSEGTWAWAESIGLRAVSVESQDHYEGAPTRPKLREQFYARDRQLHGTGELVSWTTGNELAPLGLEAVVREIEQAYTSFLAGECDEAATEKRVCDLFMAARCGDYLDRLLEFIRRHPCTGWVGAICRALQAELLLNPAPAALLHSRAFWRRSLLPELLRVFPPGPWDDDLPWASYRQTATRRFGEAILWSSGACGQVLREAIHVDWTDLVIEQGLCLTLIGRNALDPSNRSFARWLTRPLEWKCRRLAAGVSSQRALRDHLLKALAARQPKLGPDGWRIGPEHWARILEWVLIWRREITSPEMLERARGLAGLILRDSFIGSPVNERDPIARRQHEHETPRAVGDIPLRLHHSVDWERPNDYRLTDEIYPAIGAVVAAWLRGSGQSSCPSDVFSKAPWLSDLMPVRRLRMVEVLIAISTYAKLNRSTILEEGVCAAALEKHVAGSLSIGLTAFREWMESQALDEVEIARLVVQLAQGTEVDAHQTQHLPERVHVSGTALPAGIHQDVEWGVLAVAEQLRSKPLDLSFG